jgi:hypothetical protein
VGFNLHPISIVRRRHTYRLRGAALTDTTVWAAINNFIEQRVLERLVRPASNQPCSVDEIWGAFCDRHDVPAPTSRTGQNRLRQAILKDIAKTADKDTKAVMATLKLWASFEALIALFCPSALSNEVIVAASTRSQPCPIHVSRDENDPTFVWNIATLSAIRQSSLGTAVLAAADQLWPNDDLVSAINELDASNIAGPASLALARVDDQYVLQRRY